jgi:hypothetical protein
LVETDDYFETAEDCVCYRTFISSCFVFDDEQHNYGQNNKHGDALPDKEVQRWAFITARVHLVESFGADSTQSSLVTMGTLSVKYSLKQKKNNIRKQYFKNLGHL